MAQMNTARAEVETNISGSVDFSFSKDAAAKLSLMMSDFLYSDKEYAVISELSANAVDANRLVGKNDKPILVQLPTAIEPVFAVTDDGPGMSEEDVYKYLTSYGETSKDGTNDQIGFWGIGSKSPAAVTDSWSIVSHHGGVKKQYEVFVTGKGIPTLKKIFEAPTDKTGLEVRLHVDKNNFNVWKDAARRAYQFYEVLPDTNVDLRLNPVTYETKTETFGIRKRDWSSWSGIRLITTMRGYNLEYNKIIGALREKNMLLEVDMLTDSKLSQDLDLFFNVGEIDLSISREQVQFNEKTLNAIVKRIAEITAFYKEQIETDLKKVENNGILYRVELDRWVRAINARKFLENLIKGNKHNVVAIPRDINNIIIDVPKNYDLEKIVIVKGDASKYFLHSFSCWKTNNIRNISSYYANTDKKIQITTSVVENVVIVIKDVRDATARVKYLNDKERYHIIVEKNFFGKEFKVIKASKLAKAPRKARETRDKVAFSGHYILRGNRMLRTDEKELAGFAKKVAVKVENARDIHDGFYTKEILLLRELGYHVIGYSKTTTINDAMTELKKVYKEMSNQPELKAAEEQINTARMLDLCAESTTGVILCKYLLKSEKWNSIVAPLKAAIDYYQKNNSMRLSIAIAHTSITKYNKICNILGKKHISNMVHDDDVKKVINNLQKMYPMLKYMNESTWSPARHEIHGDIIRYVELIDKE